MTIKQAIAWASKELTQIAQRPRLEAEILLCHMLNVKREFLILNDSKSIDFQEYKILINRRKKSEPIEYITNKVSFWDFELFIAKGALIPRPETELLVEKAITLINKHNIKNVAEIGIGSGAISIAVAKECNVKILASDISLDAIKIANKNIQNFNLQNKITVKNCSLLDCIDIPELLLSNPPYIDKNFTLEKNILEYEPHTALFAPNKGLEILFNILDLIKQKNIPYAICEMGYDQKEPILNYAKTLNIADNLTFYKDLAGFDRGFVYNKSNK